jgi:hypothetical protein
MLWRPSGPLCYKVKDDMLSIQRRSKIYFGRKQKGQESCFAVGGGRVREVLDTGLLGGVRYRALRRRIAKTMT